MLNLEDQTSRNFVRALRFAAACLLVALLITPVAQAQAVGWVSLPGDGSLAQIDSSTNTTVGTVPGLDNPQNLVASPDGSLLYVASNGGVTVVDTATLSVVEAIALGGPHSSIDISPDGSTLWTQSLYTALSVIDTATRTVVGSVPNGGVAFTPDGAEAWVASFYPPAVTVYDAATRAVLSSFTTSVSDPSGIAISPDGAFAYIGHYNAHVVTVVDTATQATVATIPTGASQPWDIIIPPDGTYAYVAHRFGGVAVIDTASQAVVANLATGSGNASLALTPDASSLYVTAPFNNQVSEIDTATHTIVDTFSPGSFPSGIVLTPSVDMSGITDDFEDGLIDPEWTLVGVGNANQQSAVETGGVLELTADGATAFYGADNAGFLFREVTGDFRMEVTVDGNTMTTGGQYRKAGLMVRQSLDKWDVRLIAQLVPFWENRDETHLQFVAREAYGEPGRLPVSYDVVGVPRIVRLAVIRAGDTLSVEYSVDGGATWLIPSTGLGGSITIPGLASTLLVGLDMVSNNISVTSTVRFDDFVLDTDP